MVYFPNSERKKKGRRTYQYKTRKKRRYRKKKNEKLKTSGKNELKYINYRNNVNGLNSPIKRPSLAE